MLVLSWQMQYESGDFLCILRDKRLQEGWEFLPDSALSWLLREKSKKSESKTKKKRSASKFMRNFSGKHPNFMKLDVNLGWALRQA